MSYDEYEQLYYNIGSQVLWFGQKVIEFDKEKLIVVIGYMIKEIAEKDKRIDKYLDMMEERNRLRD